MTILEESIIWLALGVLVLGLLGTMEYLDNRYHFTDSKVIRRIFTNED